MFRRFFYKLSCLILAGCTTEYTIDIPVQPSLVPVDNDLFAVGSDFPVFINRMPYVVPRGFLTDLASVPRVFWWFNAPNDFNTIAPAVLHDYLYSVDTKYNRKQIDDIFYSALIENGATKATAFKFWLGVRLFGAWHYKS